MKRGCAACLDDNHDDCYSDDCPCLLETNHGRIMYDSSIETGEIAFRVKHSDNDRIDFIATALISKYNFVTAIESDKIYLFTGKIYETEKAISIIKEETEKRILECTERDTLEVISKIKRKTYKDLKDFDSDPNVINCESGLLDLRTMKVKPHTPTYLSKVLIPCNYHEPRTKDIKLIYKKLCFGNT